MTGNADFKAIVRARARRRDVRYAQARRELLGSAGAGAGGATRHVTSGESTAGTLAELGLDGPVLAWRDVLHEGPVPADLGPAELRAVRARFLAESGLADQASALRAFEERDAALLGAERYVLWFEADLYDQLQLIEVLDALAAGGVGPEQIALVSAGEFPGIAHFGGLGELPAAALAGLLEQRVALTAEAVALARSAWRAFRAPEPSALAALAGVHSRELRFLGEAIERLLQEYPWRGDGLGLTERRALRALADGEASAADLFRRVWARERRPYLGDHVFLSQLRRLAGGAQPLIELGPDAQPFRERSVALTEMGRSVLAGSFGYLEINPIDRWIGGVHLTGTAAWRYDERRETIVPA